MLVINKEALCNTCLKKLKVVQKDNEENGEKWVCPAYTKGIPDDITIKAKKCKYYKEDV